MSAEPPIPKELWDQVPAAAQAALLIVIHSLERRDAALAARMDQNSSSSSKPPSSDPLHVKRRPPRPPSGRRRGGRRRGRRDRLARGATAGLALDRGHDQCDGLPHRPLAGGRALHALVGLPVGPVVICDRFSTSARAPGRQTCWSHLGRDFVSRTDRAAGGQTVGARLLHFSGSVLAWWQRHEAGSITRSTLRSYAEGLKRVVRTLLESGAACDCPWTAKVCRKLLAGFAHLWTFATVEGVPPHNNAAERALRHGVSWRRTDCLRARNLGAALPGVLV